MREVPDAPANEDVPDQVPPFTRRFGDTDLTLDDGGLDRQPFCVLRQ
jgi:hypothetical protein